MDEYKEQVMDVLASDPILLKEIEYDRKKLLERQETERYFFHLQKFDSWQIRKF